MEQMDSASAASEKCDLAALMRSVADGDRNALRPLYERTSAKLYGICLRILHDPDDAQDVLQAVFLTVWQKARIFDPSKASAITWLAVMTRNRAIDLQRRHREKFEDINSASDVPNGDDSALELIEKAEDRDRLNDCLGELEIRHSAMIRAAFLDGATYPELARREGVPLPTMKSWIRRGLLRLRSCLER